MGHKEDGQAFLTENAKHDDVNVTASGLQYTVIKEQGDCIKIGLVIFLRMWCRVSICNVWCEYCLLRCLF